MRPEINAYCGEKGHSPSPQTGSELFEHTVGIHCALRIRLQKETSFWGIGIAQLLHGIEKTHSLRAAAQTMHISYSKAWKILRNAEKELGFPLLDSSTGGHDGGGSILTAKAVKLLTAYDEMVRKTEETMEHCFRKIMIPVLRGDVNGEQESAAET